MEEGEGRGKEREGGALRNKRLASCALEQCSMPRPLIWRMRFLQTDIRLVLVVGSRVLPEGAGSNWPRPLPAESSSGTISLASPV